MRILLLGATGRTGKLVLNYALAQGFEVNCLARNVERIDEGEGVRLYEGNPTNREDLTKAISGCDAVINVLNVSRTSDFPWAKLKTPKSFLSDVMSQLIPVAKDSNIQRIAICSAWGVADSRKDIPGWFRWFVDNSNIGAAYQDHERQEKLLTDSDLNWTIVRPVGLTNSKKSESVLESFDNNPKPSLTISRQSVAEYLVNCLTNEHLKNKKVVISKS